MPGQARDFGGERRLVDADHLRAHLLQCPAPAAGADAEIETDLARPGPAPDQGQRLPQFQIGAARRPGAVLDEADLAIRKRAGAMRRREHRLGIEQGPRAERCRRRRCPEDERLRRDLRQLLLDQRRAPVEARAHRAPNCAGSRAALRPRRRSRRSRSPADRARHSPPMPRGAAAPAAISRRPCLVSTRPELIGELVDISLGGEIGGANSSRRARHRTPGLARRGTFAKFRAWPIDREIAELARAIARARRAVVFTGAGISTEFGHSRFPQPRRDLDPHGADRLLGFPRLGGGAARNLAAALCNGGDLSRSGPEPRPPRRRRAGPPRHGRRRDHAEHRRSAPGLRHPRRAGHRAARQHDLCALPRLQDALRARRAAHRLRARRDAAVV